MDELLPVWAQPHRFWLLDQRQRDVFTFGLVLTDVHLLRDPEGVRRFGRRYGFEWLAGLSQGVQHETGQTLPPSELETFLLEQHGIVGPRKLSGEHWHLVDGSAGEPSDPVLAAFAGTHGALIRTWSLNAFNGLEASLANWARARQRVPVGYGDAAERRLTLTQMPHTLHSLNAIDGSHHHARHYRSLYERIALELEDLALRRPTPRLCPLCHRVYIPLRPRQPTCGNHTWDATRRQLVQRCTPPSDTTAWSEAIAADYSKRRKTRWATMNRIRSTYGHNHPRTEQAIKEWENWRSENPPPRKPGRPPRTVAKHDEPPYHPPAEQEPTPRPDR